MVFFKCSTVIIKSLFHYILVNCSLTKFPPSASLNSFPAPPHPLPMGLNPNPDPENNHIHCIGK